MIRVVKTGACFFCCCFLFSFLTPSLAIKKMVVIAFVLFLFSFFPPSALIRKAERKRVYSPSEER